MMQEQPGCLSIPVAVEEFGVRIKPSRCSHFCGQTLDNPLSLIFYSLAFNDMFAVLKTGSVIIENVFCDLFGGQVTVYSSSNRHMSRTAVILVVCLLQLLIKLCQSLG